jgi:hypothetical protein
VMLSCGDLGLFGESVGEVLEVDVLDEGVELAGGTLFLVAFAGDSDSDSVGEVADTLVPDELVELRVDADVGSAHHGGDQLLDFGDGSGGFALELGAVSQFVDVDGGVDGSFGESSPLFFLDHISQLIIKY